ncbi:hypothetical protein B4099_0637 [Heyndrickxia coagulans]|uniref:Uncharacterized protein n=1 Tax=Heyndrickxia coagulans TaxID=1398 RepID=A0A150KI19_HEYCO|nr:hypothetical protein B4099_0637 [Heyndrickxia coagulans]
MAIFSIKRKTGVLTVGVPPCLREGHLYIGKTRRPLLEEVFEFCLK